MRQRITIALFLAIVTTPLLINLATWRNKTKLPPYDHRFSHKASSLPGKIIGQYRDVVARIFELNKYYENEMSIRPIILPVYFSIQEEMFGLDAFPQKVLKGDDGWLFLGNSYSNIVSEAKGLSNFKDDDLRKIGDLAVQRRKQLSDLGITYVPAIAPEKLSVYGQYLHIEKSTLPTKREQVKQIFEMRSLPLVDMSVNFKDHASKQLYFKTDSHWNDLGAYLGYLAVMNEIHRDHPDVHVVQIDEIKRGKVATGPNDLTYLYGRKDKELQLVFTIKDPKAELVKEKRLAIPLDIYTDRTAYEDRFINPARKYKVLMFRDSFGSATMKYFAESFGEVVFIFSGFDQNVIDVEKPDIVIHEVTERDLDFWTGTTSR